MRAARPSSGFLSPAILGDLWETRVGRVLRRLGLDSVRTTIMTLAVVATLIPALATSVVFYRQNRRAIEAKLNEQLSGASNQASQEMGLWLKERLYDLRVFASSYEVTDNIVHATPQTRRRLSDYLTSVNDRFPDYDELMVVTPDLNTVASSRQVPGSLHLTGTWLQQVRVGDRVLGNPAVDSAGHTTMEIAVPIQNPAGRFLGVLAGRLNFRGIEQLLREELRGRLDRILIVRAGGQAVASAGGTLTALPGAVFRKLHRADSTAVSYTAADGHEVVGAMADVSSSDWSAVAEISAATAYREIRRLGVVTAIMLVALLAVVGSLAYGLGLLIVRPLDRLTLAASRVAAGDLAVDVPASGGGGGELAHLAGVFNDMVRRLREGRAELERLSVTDELTGLANRRRLVAELEREVRRSERHGHPLSLLMLDVDHFKAFNDAHGHPAGDTVLQRLADTLRKCVREMDTVARWGGEEFLVMVPETAEEETARVAERIRAAVEQDRLEAGGGGVGVTVSIGTASFPHDAKAPDELIGAADRALYRSKAAGRNRVSAARLGDKARAGA